MEFMTANLGDLDAARRGMQRSEFLRKGAHDENRAMHALSIADRPSPTKWGACVGSAHNPSRYAIASSRSVMIGISGSVLMMTLP